MNGTISIPGFTPVSGQNTKKSTGGNSPVLSHSFSTGNNNSSPIVVETVEDMITAPKLWKILHFGIQSTGKTHFGLTMPAPIIVIETENRVQLIAGKFKVCKECGTEWYTKMLSCPSCGKIAPKPKDIRRIKVRTMEQIYQAVEHALGILTYEREVTGRVGTIMIDSFSEAWVQAAQEYIQQNYGGNKNAKLSPRDDYKFINPRHNDLRKDIIDSGFNVYFTATQTDEFGEDQFKPIGVKPEGQKHNPYAVDWFMWSFFKNDQQLYTRLEKNSITLRKIEEYTKFDFQKLVSVAKKFEEEEKMITTELLDQYKEEITEEEETEPEIKEEGEEQNE